MLWVEVWGYFFLVSLFNVSQHIDYFMHFFSVKGVGHSEALQTPPRLSKKPNFVFFLGRLPLKDVFKHSDCVPIRVAKNILLRGNLTSLANISPEIA